MATLKPFKSSTLEGAFLEAAFLLEKIETALNYKIRRSNELNKHQQANTQSSQQTSPSKPDVPETHYIKISIDTDGQKCVITATLPARIKENSFGGYLLAKEFFPDTSFEYVDDSNLEQIT